MHLTYLTIILCVCLFNNFTYQNDSVISFQPSSISTTVGENKSVSIRLRQLNLTFPITLVFLYDGELNDTEGYIDRIPNITFTNSTAGSSNQIINLNCRREGHIVLTANSSEVNISSSVDFLLIDIAHSHVLNIFIQIVVF